MADDDRMARMAEAYRRGILPADKVPLFEEAMRRGLVPGAKVPESEPQGQPKDQTQDVDEYAAEKRGLGLGTRSVVQGGLGLADIAASPVRAGMNKINQMLGGSPEYFKPIAPTLADTLGLPKPQTPKERIFDAAVQGATGALPTMGAGMAMQMAGKFPAIAEALSAMPAVQAASGATGGGAQQLAAESGAGPVGQIASGLAGGLAPIGAISAFSPASIARGLINPEKAAAFQQAGVTPPSLGTVTDSGAVQGLEGALRQLLPSAGTMKRAQEAGNRALTDVIEETSAKMARGGAVPQSLEEMGHIAAVGARTSKDAFRDAARTFENTVYEPLGQLSAELNNVMGFIEDQAARFSPEVGKAYRERMLKELGSVAKDAEKRLSIKGAPISAEELQAQPYLKGAVTEEPGALNVASLRDWRGGIGERLKQQGAATTSDATQGELRQLYKQASRDIEAALPEAGLQDVQSYNKWFAENKQLQDSVEKTFFGNRDATGTAKAVLSADADQLSSLLKVVGPEEFDKIRSGALRELSRGKEGFSHAYAQKALSGGRGGVQEPARDVLFRGEESPVLAMARALAESRNAANTSNTGGVNAAAQLMGMGAGGVLNLPLTAIGSAIPYGLSKAVTSPTAIEFLIKKALAPQTAAPSAFYPAVQPFVREQ